MLVESKDIKDAVKYYLEGSYLNSDYLYDQLKKNTVINIIKEICDLSDKSPIESILILLASIKYLLKDYNALLKLQENNSFEAFVTDKKKEIIRIAVEKRIQGNSPERGLPLIEVLQKKLADKPFAVIELGASYGLIGDCMINPGFLIRNKEKYLSPGQKLPEKWKAAEKYLGIDINPPDKDWLLACYPNNYDANRIDNYLKHNIRKENFKLIAASALGFSKLKETEEIVRNGLKPVILTSFILYQLNENQRNDLEKEISDFIQKHDGHWLKQEVIFRQELQKPDYILEWDNKKIAVLADDKCSDWELIDEEYIEYRELNSNDEFYQCVELQKRTLGITDAEAISPLLMQLYSKNLPPIGIAAGIIRHNKDKSELIGFITGTATAHNKEIYATVMGIKPGLHNKGLGFKLYLKFRELSVNKGFEAMYGRYNHLESKLGWLYMTNLGFTGIYYDIDLTPIPQDEQRIPNDRILVKWHFNSQETLKRIQGVKTNKNSLICEKNIANANYLPAISPVLIEIPDNFYQLKTDSFKKALEWHSTIRLLMTEYLNNRGYIVTDLLRNIEKNYIISYYLLEKNDHI